MPVSAKTAGSGTVRMTAAWAPKTDVAEQRRRTLLASDLESFPMAKIRSWGRMSKWTSRNTWSRTFQVVGGIGVIVRGVDLLKRRDKRRHECRRGRHECPRHKSSSVTSKKKNERCVGGRTRSCFSYSSL